MADPIAGETFLGSQDWPVALASALVAAGAFLAVAALLSRRVRWAERGRGASLVWGTIAVFVATGTGYLIRAWQLVGPPAWTGVDAGAARMHMGAWPWWILDAAAAGAGMMYLLLRRRYRDLVRGGTLYDDLHRRRQRALAVQDEVVQRLVRVRWHLDLGQQEAAAAALAELQGSADRVLEAFDGDDARASP